LKKNNMDAYFVESEQEAVELAFSMIEKGSTVGVGGSVTLNQLGVLDILRNGDYNFLDRYATTDREEIEEIFHRTLLADTYLCSANAITEKGELYNVDGTNNRVAALLYGPKSVIVIAGVNKIVKDLEEAVVRVKTIAAPLNCKRLGKKTYCAEKGVCYTLSGEADKITDGCQSPDRICRNYVVSGPQVQKGRIKVILVNRELGF
ncbi:MAG: lactate utilization protein, partial [Clostridia bacterium]|nr:lactate utilization protein [Clostridia bacterium]